MLLHSESVVALTSTFKDLCLGCVMQLLLSFCWHVVLPRMQHLLHMLQDAACSLCAGQHAANTCACTYKEMRYNALSAGD